MRLYECEAKQLLSERGIPVPDGGLADSATEAQTLARSLGGAAVKAQVLHGGRMKAGLIELTDDSDAAAAAAARLLAAPARHGRVERVLVEERLETTDERFLAALYDSRKRMPVLIYTAKGGIEVERDGAAELARLEVDPRAPVADFRVRSALRRAGVTGHDLRALTTIAVVVARMLLELDATLVEINPLARTTGRGWVALDAHLELDGDALVRHPDLVERFSLADRGEGGRPATAAERAAAALDAADHRGVAGRLVELDGDIALIVGGGGASLTVVDAIRDAGGQPANYCEVGGNPSVTKVTQFTKLLIDRLQPRGLAVISNVVSNTRADLVARGVIQGCLEAGRQPEDMITVFRVPGAWEDESRELLADYGIEAIGRETSLDEAARAAVEAAAQ